MNRPRILAIQAGLGGADGNGSVLLGHALEHLTPHADVETVVLASSPGFAPHRAALDRADGVVIASGTYWDGFSSLLQRFFEEATETEGTELWLGKPVACLISAHSAGGKAVLSRLQGVLVTLGAQIPPMGGLVVTLAAQIAREHATAEEAADLWGVDDLDIVCHNLVVAARADRTAYRAWTVDRADPARRWLR